MTPSDLLTNLSTSDHCGLARRQVLVLGVLVPAVVALLGGCSLASGTQLTSKVAHEKASLSDVASQVTKAATACDQLGSKLLTHYLKEDPAATALAFPLSFAFVLVILAGGATDAAAQGYDAFLGLSGEGRDRAWSAIQNSLNRYDSDPKGFDPDKVPDKPLVRLANHVLISDDKKFKVKQTYLDTVLCWFSIKIEQVGAGPMKENLDAWASRNTADLVPGSGIDVIQDTRLVVQNALLFAAQWESPFEARSTSRRNFTLAGGKTVKADLMHDTRSTPHATGRGWAVVRSTYAGGQDRRDSDLALNVVLPDVGTLPSAINAGIWAETSTALDKMRPREVELALPKLDLTSKPKEFLDFLKEQGFKLGGLDKIAPELALTQVVQQIHLILDEEGVVAVTLSEGQVAAMVALAEQIKPITFTVDHPHVLQLRDLTSGTALLEVTIMDPTVKEISGSA